MRFLATLVGLGAVGSAIAWSPWFFVPAMLAISWALIDSAHRIHTTVPTGDVVAGVRKVLREAAGVGMEMRSRVETLTDRECKIWFDHIADFVGRALGLPDKEEFSRAVEGTGFEGLHGKPKYRRVFLYMHSGWLRDRANTVTDKDILSTYDPYSRD